MRRYAPGSSGPQPQQLKFWFKFVSIFRVKLFQFGVEFLRIERVRLERVRIERVRIKQ